MTGQIISIMVCLVFSALFSCGETAFTSLTVFQIETLKRKSKRGAIVAKLASNPDGLISTILIGNNIVNILASALSTKIALFLWGDNGISIATGILTFIILIFGEVSPKRIAIAHNEGVALTLSVFLLACTWLLKPFVIIINLISSLITRLFGKNAKGNLSMNSVIEMMSAAEHMGIIDYAKSQMVKNVFRLDATTVQAIMTHRMNVYSLPIETTIKDACSEVQENSFSVFPVYKDESENIVGIVSLREAVVELVAGNGEHKLSTIMHEALFVLPNKPIEDLFSLFKKEHATFAVVIDEYGGLAGIVTIDDIVKEIIGSVKTSNNGKSEKVTQNKDGLYTVSGDTALSTLAEIAGTEAPTMPYVQTVAGYIAWALDRIPVPGDKVDTALGIFLVEVVDANRVETAKFTPVESSYEN